MTKKNGLPKVHINTVKGSLIDNHHMECEPIFINGYFITRTQVETVLEALHGVEVCEDDEIYEDAIKILEGE